MDDTESQESLDLLSRALDAAGHRWIVNQALAEIVIAESDEGAAKISDSGDDVMRQPQLLSPRERLIVLIDSVRRATTDSLAVESDVIDFYARQASEHALEPALYISSEVGTLDVGSVRLDATSVEQRNRAVPPLLAALDQLRELAIQ